MTLIALIGAKALFLLFGWLLSAIAAEYLSARPVSNWLDGSVAITPSAATTKSETYPLLTKA